MRKYARLAPGPRPTLTLLEGPEAGPAETPAVIELEGCYACVNRDGMLRDRPMWMRKGPLELASDSVGARNSRRTPSYCTYLPVHPCSTRPTSFSPSLPPMSPIPCSQGHPTRHLLGNEKALLLYPYNGALKEQWLRALTAAIAGGTGDQGIDSSYRKCGPVLFPDIRRWPRGP